MRQNNQHLQEEAEFVAVQMRVRTLQGLAENSETGRLAYSHLGEQPLTEVDELRKIDWFASLFTQWQWEFGRERSELVKQYDSIGHLASVFRASMNRWNAEEAWRERKDRYRADFREFMDTQVIGPG